MAYKFACSGCLKPFKGAKGAHWHAKKTGHQVFPLPREVREEVVGLNREEATEMMVYRFG